MTTYIRTFNKAKTILCILRFQNIANFTSWFNYLFWLKEKSLALFNGKEIFMLHSQIFQFVPRIFHWELLLGMNINYSCFAIYFAQILRNTSMFTHCTAGSFPFSKLFKSFDMYVFKSLWLGPTCAFTWIVRNSSTKRSALYSTDV